MSTPQPCTLPKRLVEETAGPQAQGMPDVDELIAEGAAAPVEGWDFSWYAGRATEERPHRGYAGLLADRLARASSSLDVQTGGAEVYAEALGRAARRPTAVAATESWPPNLALARRRLAAWRGESPRRPTTAGCRSPSQGPRVQPAGSGLEWRPVLL